VSEFEAATAIEMVGSTSRLVADEADELSRLDAVAGDGDHGVNMSAAFADASARIARRRPASAAETFLLVGQAFSEGGGGSAGALFGTFFDALGSRLLVNAKPDVVDLVDALEVGTRRVAELGRTAPGDKTMLDALQPAVEAARSTIEAGGDLTAVLSAAAEAAAFGAASTAHMRAKAGRARYAEDGAVGTRDPGAATIAIMFAAWGEALAQGVGS
jgi:dihydroxyacetone kinase